MPKPSSIQEQIDAFHQRILASERLYRDAIAALANDQIRQQLEQAPAYRQPDPQPSPRRRLLRTPWLALARGASRLVSLGLRRQAKNVEIEPGSGSDSEPVIIDVDVVYVDDVNSDPSSAHPQGLGSHLS
jgi:hypothetical protein